MDKHDIKMTSFMIGDFPGFSPAGYEQQLVDEFDQLYAEGGPADASAVSGEACAG